MSKSMFAVLILALTLIFASCVAPAAPAPVAPVAGGDAEPMAADSGAAEGQAGATPGGIFVRAMTSEPATIDPQGAPSSGLSLVLPYLFDTLAVRDVDNSLHPGLAESWQASPDGKSVTVQLKPGVVFQDGTPLNAEAVKFTFERFKEKGQKSPIYGGVQQIASIEAVDDLTVRFNFGEPAANFWSTLTMPYAGIISPASAKAFDETGEGALVGTGPFKLGEWQAGQSITLERNPDYAWGPDVVQNQQAPYLERMVFKVIPDATTQLAALEAGEVDSIFINQPAHRMQLEGNPQVGLEETVLNSLIYLGYNTQKAPFDETLVRQALSHAVNKDEIVAIALGGLGIAAFAPLPPTLPGFDASLKAYELGYDPEKAKALLQEAGFEPATDGAWQREGQPLQGILLTSNRPPNEAIATLLQSQLAAIGVPVEIQQLDGKAVMEAANQGAFDLILWRYDWNDPDALAVFLGSDRIGGTNRVNYSNPALDEHLQKGARELDDTARHQIYLEAQQLILQDAPWQPLYNPIDLMAMSDRLAGLKVGYMGRTLVNDAYVVDK